VQHKVAHVGGTVRLNCSTSQKVYVEWKHGREFVYVNGAIDVSLRSNYSIDNSTTGQYTLVIKKVTAAGAGVYKCIDNAGSGPVLATYVLTVTGKKSSHRVMF